MQPELEIKIPPPEGFRNNKIKGGFPDLLRLYEGHLEVKWRLQVERTIEETSEVKDLHFRGEKMFMRSAIVGVTACYNTTDETFECEILGIYGTIYIFTVSTFEEARKIKAAIQQWILGQTPVYE